MIKHIVSVEAGIFPECARVITCNNRVGKSTMSGYFCIARLKEWNELNKDKSKSPVIRKKINTQREFATWSDTTERHVRKTEIKVYDDLSHVRRNGRLHIPLFIGLCGEAPPHSSMLEEVSFLMEYLQSHQRRNLYYEGQRQSYNLREKSTRTFGTTGPDHCATNDNLGSKKLLLQVRYQELFHRETGRHSKKQSHRRTSNSGINAGDDDTRCKRNRVNS